MPKTREQKEKDLELLKDRLSRTSAGVFATFDGLSVQEADELRKTLRDAGVDYVVAKKTLLKMALEGSSIEGVDVDALEGGLGLATGYDDEVVPAKTLQAFSKKHEGLQLVGGIYNNAFISADEVKALASVPSKEELYSKVVWLFNYPTTGLVNVLAGSMRSLVYALKAIQESKA